MEKKLKPHEILADKSNMICACPDTDSLAVIVKKSGQIVKVAPLAGRSLAGRTRGFHRARFESLALHQNQGFVSGAVQNREAGNDAENDRPLAKRANTNENNA